MASYAYRMSHFTQGGITDSEPHITGANYIRKTSNYAGDDREANVNGDTQAFSGSSPVSGCRR